MGKGSKQRSRWAGVALTAAVLLSACGGGSDDDRSGRGAEPNVVQPGAPGEPSTKLSAEELAELEPTRHTPADVDFMRGMIHHHAQALVMTGMVRERSASQDIPLLARRTEISQESEIETMERWLRARGEKPPDAEDHRDNHGPHGQLMPGMVSADKLARLAAADGGAFDARFLRYMIRHHRGALVMVRRLLEDGGGAEPEIGVFTRHVEADQNIEISRMQDLLGRVERESSRSAPRRERPSSAAQERARRLAYAGGRPLICFIR